MADAAPGLIPKRIGDAIPFSGMAGLLEKVTAATDGPKKAHLIKKYMDYGRTFFKDIHNGSLDSEKANGDSLYCIVRILLPTEDRGRRAYGIKAQVLGRMFAAILGLDKNSPDGKKLIHFKNPEKAGSSAGDFGTLFYSVLESRFSESTSSPPTVSDFHEVLDRLARNKDVNIDTQKQILQGFIRRLTPLEGKWLSRILLKSMQLGVNSSIIYKMIHPQAKEMYDRTGDLEKMCQKLNDPSISIEITPVTLFNHCGSMLCTRMTIVDDGFEADLDDGDGSPPEKKSRTKDPVKLPTPPFVVETKWDGERFQIHFDGSELKYLSRRKHDFSGNFNQTLTPRLRPQIRSGVTSFILDGEMMAWNPKYKTFTLKGGQIDVKRMNLNNPNHVPTFVAFDIMFFNGKIVIDEPQFKRMEMIRQILNPKEGVILITEERLMNTKEQVLEALNEAIDNFEEGLIVKDINSKYQPGKRPVTWLKIKPEYLDDTSVDDLDLLILGASYTDSVRKGGTISHFLVGVIDQSGPKEMFYPVARVGSGRLRHPQMKSLVEELLPLCGKTEFTNVVYKGPKGKRPDLFINPKDSIVVQVKASEINRSDNYAVNYSLRFPRIVKVRKDKPYDEVMSIQEFERLRTSCGGKLAKRTDGKGVPFRKRKKAVSDDENSNEDDPVTKPITINSDDENGDGETRSRPGPSRAATKPMFIKVPAISPLKDISTKKPNVKGPNIFNAQVFCVYGSRDWKDKMENDIKAHGGQIVQNPVKEKFWILGEKPENIKVEKAIKSGNYDVLKSSWLLRCIENKTEVARIPTDFFHYTEATGKQFQDKYDEFGDSYTECVSLEGAKSLVSKVMSTMQSEDDMETNEEEDVDYTFDELPKELFSKDDNQKIKKYSFLKSCKVTFMCDADPVLVAQLEFYGGTVAKRETDEGITHVINDNPLSPKKKNSKSAYVVKPQWLKDSIKEKEVLPEYLYSV